jgi:hypothetical protein
MINKFLVIKFQKEYKEDALVDLITVILKNLYHNGYSFYLDNVLISKNRYDFIFGGNIKNYKILINNISDYIKISKYCIRT